ncbi:hypothetical protein ACFFWD_08040 [Bradyrhizobium erythrophlei]|uniref:hypothetical protein n=1 Tax=Bradyrhizobium erythrophlei TaxID=1437360 RepID=UPI0035E79DFC
MKKTSEHVPPEVIDKLVFYVNDAILVLQRKYPWLYNDDAGRVSCCIKQSK